MENDRFIQKRWKYLSFALIGMLAALGVAGFFSDMITPEVLAAPLKAASDVICNGCVGTTDIADSAVTTAKIADSAVTTAKIEPGAVSMTVNEKYEFGTVVGSSADSVTANCFSYVETAVGGGYATTGTLNVLSSSRSGLGVGNGWTVTAANTSPTDQTLIVYVECARLFP